MPSPKHTNRIVLKNKSQNTTLADETNDSELSDVCHQLTAASKRG